VNFRRRVYALYDYTLRGGGGDEKGRAVSARPYSKAKKTDKERRSKPQTSLGK